MYLRKDVTINERVFHQNINSGPSIVSRIISFLSIAYLPSKCGPRIICGHFRVITAVKEAFTL